MVPILYKLEGGPPSRAVSILAKALNITLDEREIDFVNQEHLSSKYLKLNPLHTIPTLDDNGNIVCDSHAINIYLTTKYARNSTLYPTDDYQRALIDQKLAFDLGILFPVLKTVNTAYIRKEIKTLTENMIQKINNVYQYLETFLKHSQWLALNHVTLADIHCFTTATSLNYHLKVNPVVYPNTVNWMKRCQELPYFDLDSKRIQYFVNYFDSLKK